MLIHNEYITATASNGTIAKNTRNIRGLCRQIQIKPATATTTYNIDITNDKDISVYCVESITGTLAEVVLLPVRGIYTINITSASRDESFLIQLVIEE